MLRRDLSYWGFQQLAHPLNGIMMTEFRPVSCDTHEPLQFDPGFINSTLYGDRVETGWAWFPYKQNTDNFWLPVCCLLNPASHGTKQGTVPVLLWPAGKA